MSIKIKAWCFIYRSEKEAFLKFYYGDQAFFLKTVMFNKDWELT